MPVLTFSDPCSFSFTDSRKTERWRREQREGGGGGGVKKTVKGARSASIDISLVAEGTTGVKLSDFTLPFYLLTFRVEGKL